MLQPVEPTPAERTRMLTRHPPTAASEVAGTDPFLALPGVSVFGELFVIRETLVRGERPLALDITHAEQITRAMRGALLHHADDPPPALLSGHMADGRPLDRPHVAFLALPELCGPGSALSVSGLALVLPRDADPRDRQAVLDAVARWERSGFRLTLGRAGVARLEHATGCSWPSALAPGTWTHPCRRWASVTPVALDLNPGDLAARDPARATQAAARAQETVARSCQRVGLPRPLSVRVMRRAAFPGAATASRFMPFPRIGRKGPRRVCVHVALEFEQPVAGPLLLGVGRYFGVGLCRPLGGES